MDSAELTVADQPAAPIDREVPRVAAPPVPVADPHPALDASIRRREAERRLDEPRSETGFSASGPDGTSERRRAERRRIDRMGTDL
jgi:hypothetical protein